MRRRPRRSTLFPYTTLFRSRWKSWRGSAGSCGLLKPLGELFLADFACGESENGEECVFLAGINLGTIHVKKGERDQQSSALIAIDKRVIGRDAKGVRGCENSKGWLGFGVSPYISGTCQCGFQQSCVPKTG